MSSLTKNTATTKRTTKASGTTTTGSRSAAAIAKIKEQIAIQKYEYYKTNRATLPSDIREHSEEITRLMEGGMSAEDAFEEVSKLCFDQ